MYSIQWVHAFCMYGIMIMYSHSYSYYISKKPGLSLQISWFCRFWVPGWTALQPHILLSLSERSPWTLETLHTTSATEYFPLVQHLLHSTFSTSHIHRFLWVWEKGRQEHSCKGSWIVWPLLCREGGDLCNKDPQETIRNDQKVNVSV